MWMESHTTKSPHGGHLKNITHPEKIHIGVSALVIALNRKSSVKTHLGQREEKGKEEQAFLDCRSDGGLQQKSKGKILSYFCQ